MSVAPPVERPASSAAPRRAKSRLRRGAERLLSWGVAAGVAGLARRLPLERLRRLADAAAWLLLYLAPSRRRLALANLRAVFGPGYTEAEYRRIVAACARNICRTMVELLKQPYLSSEQICGLVQMEGLEHLQAARAQGRGSVLLTAHFGNWEIMGARLAVEGIYLTVVARDAADRGTAALINRAREAHGLTVLARAQVRGMLAALRSGETLGLLPDQHQEGPSVRVDFLGRPAATPTGVATLALRTSAPVVPAFCRRLPEGGFRVQIQPPLELADTGDREADIRANTELCNRIIGQQIRAYPEQWLWLHRRWKA